MAKRIKLSDPDPEPKYKLPQFHGKSAMRTIRLKCLDCCAGNAKEVRVCTVLSCPSWWYRMGKRPTNPVTIAANVDALEAANNAYDTNQGA